MNKATYLAGTVVNSKNDKPLRDLKQEDISARLPRVVDFSDLTNGQDQVVIIRLEDGSTYRLQKTKFGKLLLSK